MDLKGRLKHLTKGKMAASKNIEQGIENGTINDTDADFVWNTLNLVALMEIKGVLEQEIPAITESVMKLMDYIPKYENEIAILNRFLDVMNVIKEKVDNSAAGNV